MSAVAFACTLLACAAAAHLAVPVGIAEPADVATQASIGILEPERAADHLVARAGYRVVARGGDPRALAQRTAIQYDARVARVAPPTIAVPGAEVWVEARVTNTGLNPWPAGGERPVRLSYHWLDASGSAVVWDGVRTPLGADVAPGRTVSVVAAVRVPSAEGVYTLAWDMVQEGTGWFSGSALAPASTDTVVVAADGITLYGKGWGHGSGLSQWGAQGWAQGATGVRLDGEQIALHYFPGATLGTQPPTSPFRVLLSSPSTGCVKRTIHDAARMWSAGGMRLVSDADPSVVYAEAGPNQALVFLEVGGVMYVRYDWSRGYVYIGDGPVTLVPAQWWDPITVAEKGLAYRGTIRVEVGGTGLSVVNYVSSDDYMQGVLPSEMPAHWEFEALRAQAITARTYAAWRQSTAQKRTWDVLDDIKDQCYGGWSHESPRSTAAVEATKGQILVYAGKPIRALFSSAHGGASENVGCMINVERVAGRWECARDWPYMNAVDDPAELAAYDRRGPVPQVWSRSFSAAVIRREIITDYGIDIGQFVAMHFAMSPGGRPLSVKVVGTLRVADLAGDKFLRTTLGLRSSLVRPTPF